MLKRFQMEDCKPVSTPMIIRCKLCVDDGSADVDERIYRSMIGILLYLTSFRLDIKLAVGIVARYQTTPKKIICYQLRGYLDTYKELHIMAYGI